MSPHYDYVTVLQILQIILKCNGSPVLIEKWKMFYHGLNIQMTDFDQLQKCYLSRSEDTFTVFKCILEYWVTQMGANATIKTLHSVLVKERFQAVADALLSCYGAHVKILTGESLSVNPSPMDFENTSRLTNWKMDGRETTTNPPDHFEKSSVAGKIPLSKRRGARVCPLMGKRQFGSTNVNENSFGIPDFCSPMKQRHSCPPLTNMDQLPDNAFHENPSHRKSLPPLKNCCLGSFVNVCKIGYNYFTSPKEQSDDSNPHSSSPKSKQNCAAQIFGKENTIQAKQKGSVVNRKTSKKQLFPLNTSKRNSRSKMNKLEHAFKHCGTLKGKNTSHVQKLLESEEKLLVLFSNSGLQYQGLYNYMQSTKEQSTLKLASKLHGTGPCEITEDMVYRSYVYNLAKKCFEATDMPFGAQTDAIQINKLIRSSIKLTKRK